MLRLHRVIPRSTCSVLKFQFRGVHASNHGLLDELQARGLISQVSSIDKLQTALRSPQAVYSGIDPTAKFLHVGHLLPLLCLLHFQLAGHKIVPLIGGATGLVGDPSGRDTERPLSDRSVVASNVEHLVGAVKNFFDSSIEYAQRRAAPSSSVLSELKPPAVLNNLQWLQGMGLLEFLRTVGLHARVNSMIAKESVQTRLSSQQGISFTEFTYQLLQAYDFYVLNKNEGCTIQVGGSDQWGNIVAGIDLIGKLDGKEGRKDNHAFAVTTPLLTTPSGQKFGKSAGNAVALDAKITSVFDFYQFFLRTPDSHIGTYLKMFTLIPLQNIETAIAEHKRDPELRSAQRLLASEVTELVHGQTAVHKAQVASKVLFESDYTSVKAEDILSAMSGDPRLSVLAESELLDTPVSKLAVQAKLISSNSEARRIVDAKGLYVNNKRVESYSEKLSKEQLLDGRFVVVRCGSQKQLILMTS